MNAFPNFAQYHYRVEKELGHNRAGGRVTYLATICSLGNQLLLNSSSLLKQIVGRTMMSTNARFKF